MQVAFQPSSQKDRFSALGLKASAAHLKEDVKARYSAFKDHKLTKSFMKVAKESGLKTAFKAAAAGGAGLAGANIYVVAAAGGFGYTLAEAIQEYRKAQKELQNDIEDAQDHAQGLWGKVKKTGRSLKRFGQFVAHNRGRFFGKLLKNTGLSLAFSSIGSFLADHSDVIKGALSKVPGADKVASVLGRVGQGLKSFGISAAHAAELPEHIAGVETADIIDAATPVFTLDSLDTSDWDAKALSDLAAAKKGQGWALQNLADYTANGRHGVNVDYAQARLLAEEAQAKGSKLAARFLADLDRIAPAAPDAPLDTHIAMPEADVVAAPEAVAPEAGAQSAEVSASVAQDMPEAVTAASASGLDMAALDTQDWDARALSDLKQARQGKSWALQNMAHYAANGLHGLNKDYALAREFALAAQEKGNSLSARFIANLDKVFAAHAPHGVTEKAAERVVQAASAPVKTCMASGFTKDILTAGFNQTTLNCGAPLDSIVAPNEEVVARMSENGRELRFKNGSGAGMSLQAFMERIRVTLSLNPELAQSAPRGQFAGLGPNMAAMPN